MPFLFKNWIGSDSLVTKASVPISPSRSRDGLISPVISERAAQVEGTPVEPGRGRHSQQLSNCQLNLICLIQIVVTAISALITRPRNINQERAQVVAQRGAARPPHGVGLCMNFSAKCSDALRN